MRGPPPATMQALQTSALPRPFVACTQRLTCAQRRHRRDAACRAAHSVLGGKVYLDPVLEEASAFAPATVANLGPGFDWMGCAVEVGRCFRKGYWAAQEQAVVAQSPTACCLSYMRGAASTMRWGLDSQHHCNLSHCRQRDAHLYLSPRLWRWLEAPPAAHPASLPPSRFD